jgi:hypothetical protein
MRFSGVLWLASAVAAAALASVPLLGSSAYAQEIAPVTSLEAMIRMVNQIDPDTAKEITDNLDRIDKSNRTEAEKSDAKIRYLEKKRLAVERALDLLESSGVATSEGRWAIDRIGILIGRMQAWIRGGDAEALPMFGDRDRGDLGRSALDRARAEIEAERREALLNPGSGKPEVSVSFGAGIGERSPKPQTYLATDFGGDLTLGVVSHDRDVTDTSWDVAFRYAGEFSGFQMAPSASEIVIEPFFGFSSGSSDVGLAAFDPGAGVVLGIPGTGDPSSLFPAGIALNDLVVSNDVSNIAASYDWEEIRAGLRVGVVFDPSPQVSVMPFLGLGYVHTSEHQTFGGSVADFGLDFGYDTELELDTFKLDLGARFEHDLGASWSVFAEPSASLNFISKGGLDTLELSGLVNDFQRVDLDGNETLPGVKLAVGFDFEPEASPFSLYVGAVAAYEPNTVTVHRSGELGERSEADVDYSFSYGLRASIVIKLN